MVASAACGGDPEPSAAIEASETNEGPGAQGPDLAGETGPNGGVMDHGREMDSTPDSLYPYQTDGATAVGPVAALPGGLSVLREGDRLCIELHGLPIGASAIARSCEITAYRVPEEVEDPGRAFVSEVVVNDQATHVVWGMTYLDAATVDFGPGSASTTAETHMPYWMHRFFALPAPVEADEVRILDSDGGLLAVFPLANPA
jgi:hypothetical protein